MFLLVPDWDPYRVDEDGTVLGKRGKPMTPQPNHNGYLVVYLRGPERNRLARVHHLVLETFVGPRPPGLEGVHWDDDKAHNNIINLYWGTKLENAADMRRNGLHPESRKTHCPQRHEYTPDNIYWVRVNGRMHRKCRTCILASVAERNRRKRRNN